MKQLLPLLLAIPLAAQVPAGPQSQTPAEKAEKQEAPAKPDEAKPDQKTDQQAQPAKPAAEQWLTGNIDFGYRWVSDVAGDFNTYRSVVNLGEGPKLFGVDLTIQPSSHRFVDRLNLQMNSWGGDPYNTARLDAKKEGAYYLLVDYRNIAYFNFLPSFADPLKSRGIFLNERAFDTFRRIADVELDLRPGHRIVPYLAYGSNTGRGRGTMTFVSQSNEFPVPNTMNDRTNDYRGGVRFEFNRFHITLEQGGLKYRDDEQVSYNQLNSGNSQVPFFGQPLVLRNLQQAYGMRGDSIYSKGLLTANPFSWIDIYGQFMYSRPRTDVNYTQLNQGSFVQFNPFLLYNGQFDLLNSAARAPHTSASFGFELRPFGRIRILESLMTDRLHNASAAFLTDQLVAAAAGLPGTGAVSTTDRLVTNYNQNEANVLVDLTRMLTVRGGYRYVWGDAQVRPGFLARNVNARGLEAGELKQNVGLAGLTFRVRQSFTFNADFEDASSDRTYFRTSLHDYRRGRVQARYQATSSLMLFANFGVLSNQNPTPGINYDFLSRQNSFGLNWIPAGGKWFGLLGEYERSTLRSDISYIVPNTITSDRSFYRDNANTATALLDLSVFGTGTGRPKLAVGGSVFASSGSRPTRYYQPMSRLSVPLGRHAMWNSEWRWYALSQPFYLYEGFRTHQFMTGFRLIM